MSYLLIHGHSCCEIRDSRNSIVCDPWLIGSAYWRSWWNFPCNSNLNELLDIWRNQDNFFVYITHLHWDHFHGPTLRNIQKACPNVNFIIPSTPEKRLIKDLQNVLGRKDIIQLEHTRRFKIEKNLSLLSFQSHPITTDSALSIVGEDFSLLNLNDSKLLPFSQRHLLSLIPKPDYVLRSHSSANDRCCHRNLNGEEYLLGNDKRNIDYTTEFLNACYRSGAKFAIPFASNMACLNEETFQYNKILNFADYVEDAFNSSLYKYYPGMDVKHILPNEKFCLKRNEIIVQNKIRKRLKTLERKDFLLEMKLDLEEILNKQRYLENKTTPNFKVINNYFKKFIGSIPYLFRLYLSNKLFFELYNDKENILLNVDFINCKIKKVYIFSAQEGDVKVRVNSYVFNEVCKLSNYSSLGISKRLEVWKSKNNHRYTLFVILINAFDSEGFLPLKNIFKFKFIKRWIIRYREIIDLFVYFLRLIFSRKPFYKMD